jgi:hypothetical protein
LAVANRLLNGRGMKALPFALVCVLAGGCVDELEKGDEDEAPSVDGKDDSFAKPIDHGAIAFDTAAESALAATAKFHAWDFTLSGDAKIVMTTGKPAAGGKMIDTVLYLYKEGATSWGPYIARNDDVGESLWSKITKNLGAGHYRVLVKGYAATTTGKFGVKVACTGAGCAAPEPEAACLLPDTFGEWRTSPDYNTYSDRKVTSPSELERLEADQIILALHQSSHTDVRTVEEAFARVDGGEINIVERAHRATNQIIVGIEYGAGDNSYGALLYYNTVDLAAPIHDGDLLDCTFEPPGALVGEGDDCRAQSECPTGLRCTGLTAGHGVCVSLVNLPGEDASCTTDAQCGAGLVCNGKNYGSGMCAAAWTRGTFDSIPGDPIPDNGELKTYLTAYGLATVDNDVNVRLDITHGRPNQLRIFLRNAAGSDVLVWDGPTQPTVSGTALHLDQPVGFSGDESVNGSWSLRIVDTAAGHTGTVTRWGLTLGSRWD